MDFLSRLLKFFFGLFLSGLVLAFAIAPALESLAEAEPPPDPAFATALVVVGPFVGPFAAGAGPAEQGLAGATRL